MGEGADLHQTTQARQTCDLDHRDSGGVRSPDLLGRAERGLDICWPMPWERRSAAARRILIGEPVIVLRSGQPLSDRLDGERLTVDELKVAAGWRAMAISPRSSMPSWRPTASSASSRHEKSSERARKVASGPSRARSILSQQLISEYVDQQGNDEQNAHDRPDDAASSQASLLFVRTTYPLARVAKRNTRRWLGGSRYG